MAGDEIMITPIAAGADALPAAISGTDRNSVLRLEVRRPLPEGAVVRISAGRNYSTTGQVLYSLPYRGLHYATIGIQQDEKRRESRIKVSETARVTSLHAHESVDCRAHVADVSKSGIGLVTEVRISRGVLLKVVMNSAIVFGEVRHCTARKSERGRYLVGLEIQTVIFRNEEQPAWRVVPKVLWARLTLGLETLAKAVRWYRTL